MVINNLIFFIKDELGEEAENFDRPIINNHETKLKTHLELIQANKRKKKEFPSLSLDDKTFYEIYEGGLVNNINTLSSKNKMNHKLENLADKRLNLRQTNINFSEKRYDNNYVGNVSFKNNFNNLNLNNSNILGSNPSNNNKPNPPIISFNQSSGVDKKQSENNSSYMSSSRKTSTNHNNFNISGVADVSNFNLEDGNSSNFLRLSQNTFGIVDSKTSDTKINCKLDQNKIYSVNKNFLNDSSDLRYSLSIETKNFTNFTNYTETNSYSNNITNLENKHSCYSNADINLVSKNNNIKINEIDTNVKYGQANNNCIKNKINYNKPKCIIKNNFSNDSSYLNNYINNEFIDIDSINYEYPKTPQKEIYDDNKNKYYNNFSKNSKINLTDENINITHPSNINNLSKGKNNNHPSNIIHNPSNNKINLRLIIKGKSNDSPFTRVVNTTNNKFKINYTQNNTNAIQSCSYLNDDILFYDNKKCLFNSNLQTETANKASANIIYSNKNENNCYTNNTNTNTNNSFSKPKINLILNSSNPLFNKTLINLNPNSRNIDCVENKIKNSNFILAKNSEGVGSKGFSPQTSNSESFTFNSITNRKFEKQVPNLIKLQMNSKNIFKKTEKMNKNVEIIKKLSGDDDKDIFDE